MAGSRQKGPNSYNSFPWLFMTRLINFEISLKTSGAAFAGCLVPEQEPGRGAKSEMQSITISGMGKELGGWDEGSHKNRIHSYVSCDDEWPARKLQIILLSRIELLGILGF